MKKFVLIILLCVALAICFVACDIATENPDGEQTSETLTTEEPTSEKTTTEESTTEALEFTAASFLQQPQLSWSYLLQVKVVDGQTYLNEVLYESVTYVENLNIVYTEAMLNSTTIEPEKAPILEAIKLQEHCYLLETQTETAYGQTIVAYYIDGVCYFVSFLDGEVLRIHYAIIDDDTESANNYLNNPMSSAVLLLQLQKMRIDPKDSEKYNVSVLLGTKEDPEITNAFSTTKIVAPDGDYDKALKEHREKVKEYYVSLNEPVAEALGLDKYNYCVSFYAPYIEIVFDDIAEYFACEKVLIECINNNLELVSSASVSLYLFIDTDVYLE